LGEARTQVVERAGVQSPRLDLVNQLPSNFGRKIEVTHAIANEELDEA